MKAKLILIGFIMVFVMVASMSDVEAEIIESPSSNKFDTFNKSDITKYLANHDLAKYYMAKAGHDPASLLNPGFTPLQVVAAITLISVTSLFIVRKRIKKKQT